MKNSFGHAPSNEPLRSGVVPALDLILPVDAEFVSRPPFVDPQAMLQRCEKMLSFRNGRPGESQRRFAERVLVEFAL